MKNPIYCSDCELDLKANREYMYKLKSEIWLTIANSSELLCIKCLEIRLERKLTPDDFTNESINRITQFKKSAQLIKKLIIKNVVGLVINSEIKW